MTEQINNSRIGEEKISVNELVDKLTLFDDDLMSRVFDNNFEATELILRIILATLRLFDVCYRNRRPFICVNY